MLRVWFRKEWKMKLLPRYVKTNGLETSNHRDPPPRDGGLVMIARLPGLTAGKDAGRVLMASELAQLVEQW